MDAKSTVGVGLLAVAITAAAVILIRKPTEVKEVKLPIKREYLRA